MAKHLDRHSYLADRLYVGAFLAIAAWSILTISYLEGRAAETERQDREVNEQISHEVDWLAVTQAEANSQQGRQ